MLIEKMGVAVENEHAALCDCFETGSYASTIDLSLGSARRNGTIA